MWILPHTPRYYFGHGLSYTTFAYSELQISSDEVAPFEKLTISLKVENTGDRAGDEVVQLYLHDAFASMARPVRELAGFLRVGWSPAEKKTVVLLSNPARWLFW